MAAAKLHSTGPDVGRIGPYRVERPLGRGGMGEVYAGYDDRLDRPVALKRIRTDARDPERARRRFRREARALARLHHPAIVPVHDWVETEDGDWIVMRYVEGCSLKSLLEGGALEPERAARLACDVLQGLAAAHGAGVVHRDLKAENVMVSPVGSAGGKLEQAQILDFGLAKRFEPEASETQTSADRGLIGTLSAMSPEQVLGRKVGPRSDLFSLGSLLYEMTTGVRPFQGKGPAETLNRICTLTPPPARSLRPAVPAALSAFIGQLLEKDPRRRPASAERALAELEGFLNERGITPDAGARDDRESGETLVSADDRAAARRTRILPAAAALGLLAAVAVISYRQPPDPLYVAVPETRISQRPDLRGAPGRDLELTATAVHTALLQGLLGLRDVSPVEPSAEEAGLDEPVALARSMAADEIVHSRLECRELECQVVLRRLRGDGRLLWARSITLVSEQQLLEVSLAVIEHLRAAFPRSKLRRGLYDLDVRAEDYEAYLRFSRRFKTREDGFSTDELLASLEALERTSPRFLALPVFKAFSLIQRFQEQRDPADLERAERAIARAALLAPMDPRTLSGRVQVATAAGRLEEAEAALAAFGRVEPGHAYFQVQRARILSRQGRSEEALAMMEEAVRRRPSAEHLFDLADIYYRRGDVEAARRTLEKGLERSPESYAGLSRLAQVELLNGSAELAAELYEKLIARAPEVTELTNLGTAYLLLGRYERAARRFREASGLAPGSPPVTLSHADAELLLGRTETASALYRKVLEQIGRDPRPEALLSVRAQALAHLGRAGDAVAAIQHALRLEPEHPGVAYEAALVYALLGDEASAVWNGRRALELGVESRWFEFPWFDSVRERIGGAAAR